MLIGPATDGALLQIGVLHIDGDDSVVIHAQPLRPSPTGFSDEAIMTRHTDKKSSRPPSDSRASPTHSTQRPPTWKRPTTSARSQPLPTRYAQTARPRWMSYRPPVVLPASLLRMRRTGWGDARPVSQGREVASFADSCLWRRRESNPRPQSRERMASTSVSGALISSSARLAGGVAEDQLPEDVPGSARADLAG
jgi:hypothetical protein